MSYKSIVISSGHGLYVRGAEGILDEVDEARRVTKKVAELLRARGVTVVDFHDDKSKTQDDNLAAIVGFHNSQNRELDISVHLNAYQQTSKPMGTEVLYVSEAELAGRLSAAIAGDWFIDRGGKHETGLYFLNNTTMPAVLLEICFVDSSADAEVYNQKFDQICAGIADALSPLEAAGRPDEENGDDMRTIEAGDEGEDVKTVQRILGIPEDGQFGPMTDAAVRAFQAAAGLDDTGVVDEMTWEELSQLDRRKSKAAPHLPPALQASILSKIHGMPLFLYSWDDRGIAPAGYINGMALTFALLVQMYNDGDNFARELAKAPAGDEDDALVVYEDEFKAAKMDNSATGLTTLRHLLVLMIGLGMRESSGQYYEGRDQSAENVESDTAEAGLFQTSWNINTCSDEFMDELLRSYWLDPNGWLPVFGEGLVPNATDLEHYGSGDGARYQFLAKYAPAFAVLVAALGLRLRCDHWGPINRGEVELTKEADEMLKRVQSLVCTA